MLVGTSSWCEPSQTLEGHNFGYPTFLHCQNRSRIYLGLYLYLFSQPFPALDTTVALPGVLFESLRSFTGVWAGYWRGR